MRRCCSTVCLAMIILDSVSVAPILAAAKEENLDASLPACLMRSNHISIDDPGNVDVLMSLHQR